jgi:nucleotide-binding universal stress UspA family protein
MNAQVTAETFRKILFCTDFSDNADFAFDFAIDAARRRPGAILYLIHVLAEPDAQFWKSYIYEVENVDSMAKAEINRKIETDYLPRIPAGVELRTVFRIGKPDKQILSFAKEEQVDLIVLGRQGRGLVFFGNVATKVAKNAEVPVLIVPISATAGKKQATETT